MNDVFGEASQGKWEDTDEGKARMKKWCDYLTVRLTANKYLVCDTPTVADYQGVFAMVFMLPKVTDCEKKRSTIDLKLLLTFGNPDHRGRSSAIVAFTPF